MPSHPVALELIEKVGAPIVAPSANISGKPSPTDVNHVIKDFNKKIEAIVDGGPTQVGIESTVLDILSSPPRILRPGMITAKDIESVIGINVCCNPKDSESKSPGMKYRHYAPEATVLLVESWDDVKTIIKNKKVPTSKTLILANNGLAEDLFGVSHESVSAETLYSRLRDADDKGYRQIIVFIDKEMKKQEGLMNRLEKASLKY